MPAMEMMVRQEMDFPAHNTVDNLLLTLNKTRRVNFSGFCFFTAYSIVRLTH